MSILGDDGCCYCCWVSLFFSPPFELLLRDTSYSNLMRNQPALSASIVFFFCFCFCFCFVFQIPCFYSAQGKVSVLCPMVSEVNNQMNLSSIYDTLSPIEQKLLRTPSSNKNVNATMSYLKLNKKVSFWCHR